MNLLRSAIRRSISIAATVLGARCLAASVVFTGGSGATPDAAIVLHGATNVVQAILEEDRWIRAHFDNYRVVCVSLREFRNPDGAVERISLESNQGRRRELYFSLNRSEFVRPGFAATWSLYVRHLMTNQPSLLLMGYATGVEQELRESAALEVALPFLVAQLTDQRELALSRATGSGAPNDPWKVSELAARFLVESVGYRSERRRVFGDYVRRPFGLVHADIVDYPKAVVDIQDWWQRKGHSELERGALRWYQPQE